MDKKLQSMKRQLLSGGFDEDLLERYYRALQRAGFKPCGCESGLCDSRDSPHVVNPRFGPPGTCLEPADDRVKVEYVHMCDGCAVELPIEYHLTAAKWESFRRMHGIPLARDARASDGVNPIYCSCSKCSADAGFEDSNPLSPQDEVAGLMEPTMDDLAEPDPTEEGWQEWWERDEWEDED